MYLSLNVNLLIINTFRTSTFEFGERSKGQGKRKDLDQVCEMAQDGRSVKEICVQFPATFIKHPRGIREAVALMQSPPTTAVRALVVHVVWGPTGTGKTHGSLKYLDEKYRGSVHIQRFTTSTEWWDGYVDQRSVLIDEFDGVAEVSYRRLLVLLDRFDVMLPIKGGFSQARYTEVVITSALPPVDWYPNTADISELQRRLDTGTCTNRLSLDDEFPLGGSDPNCNNNSTEVIDISDDELGMEG